MPLASTIDLSTLCNKDTAITGADLAAICKQAALCALREDLYSGQVHQRHFQMAYHQRRGNRSNQL